MTLCCIHHGWQLAPTRWQSEGRLLPQQGCVRDASLQYKKENPWLVGAMEQDVELHSAGRLVQGVVPAMSTKRKKPSLFSSFDLIDGINAFAMKKVARYRANVGTHHTGDEKKAREPAVG